MMNHKFYFFLFLSLLITGFAPATLQAQYCTGPIHGGSGTASYDDEWITNVTFADVNHSTNLAENTANTINATANVTPGQMVDFTVEVTTDGNTYTEGVAIYFDFDNDFTFETSLLLGTQNANGSGTLYNAASAPGGSNTVTMPNTPGTYRMRVVLDFLGNNLSPCNADNNNTTFKDSEDYEIVVEAVSTCSLTNLSVSNLRCGNGFNSDDAYADLSFDVSGGSGNYSVRVREVGSATSTNGNSILNAATDATINSSAQLTVGNVDYGETAEVFIWDASNNSCVSNIVTITVPTCPPCPAVGDLVITEIMQNPDAVGDSNGEWFEVYNAGTEQINMKNMVISDNDIDSHTIADDLLINPGQYVVLGNNDDTATNGGVTVDYDYGSSWFLANGADEIILICQGTEIDRVEYDNGATFPDPAGASMQLDPMSNNATDNNNGSNWCEATTPYGDGDLGTPGSANTACCAVAIDAVDVSDVNCAGGNDGVIVITVSGATTYDFSIDGPGGIQTNATGTFMGLMAGSFTITVADGDNASCTATTTATVGTAADTEDPMIDCMAEVFVNNDPGLCRATIDLPLPDTSDNCGIDRFEFRYVEVDGDNNELGAFTPFTDVTVGAMVTLPVGRYRIRFRAFDAANNTAGCNQFVTVTDNEAPVITGCAGSTVNFNGEESFHSEDVIEFDATDNCAIASVTYDPPLISCEDLGSTVTVTVTVTDIYGNPNSCTADVVVDGLPCGFMDFDEDGIGCEDSNEVNYDVPSASFTLESDGCYTGNFAQDDAAYVKAEMCGNGEIIAHITSIDPLGQGWAGITMRESEAPGAKKVELLVNLGNLIRRAVRTTTNGYAVPAQFFRPGATWLKLVRTGNQFLGYASTNGTNWQLVLGVAVPMNTCIQAGLMVTNYNGNAIVTGTFDNVSVSGAGNMNLQIPTTDHQLPEATQLLDFSFFPNPATSEVQVDLSAFAGQEAVLRIYNQVGQVLVQSRVEEATYTPEQLDLNQLPSGTYFLEVISGEYQQVKKLLKAGR